MRVTIPLGCGSAALGGLLDETNARGGEVTLATASKVCSELDNDLVIERKREPGGRNQRLRLLQPRKLLDRLDTHYTPPEVTKVFSGNWTLTEERLREELWAWAQETKKRIVLTGESSISAYVVMGTSRSRPFTVPVSRTHRNGSGSLCARHRDSPTCSSGRPGTSSYTSINAKTLSLRRFRRIWT